ncbi:hypothetical protein HK100_012482, partial [Physocladia obscura]
TVVVRRYRDDDDTPFEGMTQENDVGGSGSGSSSKAKVGFEKQNRHVCTKCGLFVAYDQKGAFTYIVDGALVVK